MDDHWTFDQSSQSSEQDRLIIWTIIELYTNMSKFKNSSSLEFLWHGHPPCWDWAHRPTIPDELCSKKENGHDKPKICMTPILEELGYIYNCQPCGIWLLFLSLSFPDRLPWWMVPLLRLLLLGWPFILKVRYLY